MKAKFAGASGCTLAAFGIVFTFCAAWVTHVVACIKTASWFLLVGGLIIPPWGWIHGFAIWFGWL